MVRYPNPARHRGARQWLLCEAVLTLVNSAPLNLHRLRSTRGGDVQLQPGLPNASDPLAQPAAIRNSPNTPLLFAWARGLERCPRHAGQRRVESLKS